MDVEEAFRTVGEFGPYQKQAVAIIVLTQVGLFVILYLDFLVRWHVCVNAAANEEECRYVACSRRITIKIFKKSDVSKDAFGWQERRCSAQGCSVIAVYMEHVIV